MFITSTSMHVMPITRFEGHPVGDGSVGPVTQLAHTRFEDYYRHYFA
jgi:branched-subunit amino acid aminotransferase/4-amino-4-deoxychorismate lyase